MKILVMGPNQINRYNWGHQLFKNEIGRQHDVIYYGRWHSGDKKHINSNANLSVLKLVDKYNPDILLTYSYCKSIKGLSSIRNKNVLKVHISIDYVPPYIKVQNKFFAIQKCDLVFGATTRAVNLLKKNKVCEKVHFLPFSADTNIYKKLNLPKINDVLAAYNCNPKRYSRRLKMIEILSGMKVKYNSSRVEHEDLIRAINDSKIVVTSNNVFKSLSMRYTETLACGSFFLTDMSEDSDRLGYIDGKHLVIYDDLEDFKNKVEYYLKPENEKEREEIAKFGMDHVRANHSCEVRVKEMTNIIIEELYSV